MEVLLIKKKYNVFTKVNSLHLKRIQINQWEELEKKITLF